MYKTQIVSTMNKKFNLIPALIIISMLFPTYSCEKEEDIQEKLDLLEGKGYYPLQIGNYWKFAGSPEKRIDSIRIINEKEYYRFIWETDNYYRRLSEGKVYFLHYDGITEEVLYDLNAEVGESWYHSMDEVTGYAERVTLSSKTDTVTLNNYTFYNCYRFNFEYTDPLMVDDEYSIWLAPNIGNVQSVGDFGRSILDEVQIDGVKIKF